MVKRKNLLVVGAAGGVTAGKLWYDGNLPDIGIDLCRIPSLADISDIVHNTLGSLGYTDEEIIRGIEKAIDIAEISIPYIITYAVTLMGVSCVKEMIKAKRKAKNLDDIVEDNQEREAKRELFKDVKIAHGSVTKNLYAFYLRKTGHLQRARDVLKDNLNTAPNDYVAWGELCLLYTDDILEGNSLETSLPEFLDSNLNFCKAYDGIRLYNPQPVGKLSTWMRAKRMKNQGSFHADLEGIRLSVIRKDRGELLSGFDRIIERVEKKEYPLPVLDDVKPDRVEKYLDAARQEELSIELMSHVTDLLSHFAKINPSREKEYTRRRKKVLMHMYRTARKREYDGESDLLRMGESKNTVVRTKKGAIVFKEGNLEDLAKEMLLTYKIKDALRDSPEYGVPTPIEVFDVEMYPGRNLGVYAMRREEGETLEERIIAKDPSLECNLRKVVEILANIHTHFGNLQEERMNLEEYCEKRLSYEIFGIPKESKDLIVSNYLPIINATNLVPYSINCDGHPENFIVNSNRITKIDNQYSQLSPITNDLANLTVYSDNLPPNLIPKILAWYFDAYTNKNPKIKMSFDSFRIAYLNSKIHRSFCFASAWSSEFFNKSYQEKIAILKRANSSIEEIRNDYPSFYEGNAPNYEAIQEGINQIILSIDRNDG